MIYQFTNFHIIIEMLLQIVKAIIFVTDKIKFLNKFELKLKLFFKDFNL